MADKLRTGWMRALCEELLNSMQSHHGFSDEMARQIEAQFHRFEETNAGDRLQVLKKIEVDHEIKTAAVKSYLEDGPEVACSRFGMSRAKLYRILKK